MSYELSSVVITGNAVNEHLVKCETLEEARDIRSLIVAKYTGKGYSRMSGSWKSEFILLELHSDITWIKEVAKLRVAKSTAIFLIEEV